MKKMIIDNIWQYEITKNNGDGLKGYGYHLDIYKNGVLVFKDGAFGSLSMAQVSARDYFLMYEFNIERDID